LKKFRQYIAAHPADVRVAREPNRDLTGKPLPPEVRVLTPEQWIVERTADAEELLWRKTCKQCHTLDSSEKNPRVLIPASTAETESEERSEAPRAKLPYVEPANVTLWWMPHAKFDHGAHEGFTCVSCHAKALTGMEAGDNLLPGIETCRTCHAPGPDHAESRCFECHTYHDWSKRREVTPKFTLPALRTGGN
jgi:Class III cytochrome C family